MAITEILRGLGSWSLKLRENTPRSILDEIQYFGHIAVSVGQINPALTQDGLLSEARYVGVVRQRDFEGDSRSLSGSDISYWLGDEEAKGEIFENPLTFTGATFQDAITAALPPSGAIVPGTLYGIASPVTGTFRYQTPRQVIKYITETYGATWRVNGDGTLDAGLEEDLFLTADDELRCAVIRRDAGVDMRLRGLLGNLKTSDDVRDFTTRVLLLAEGTEDSIVTADADIDPVKNVYRDLYGNPVKLTRLVSESQTDTTNAEARAQLQLNRFTKPRSALTMSTTEYDIKGVAQVGDYAWVHDEDLQLVDYTKEVIFRGRRINPVKLQITEMTWPVIQGMSVAYRKNPTTPGGEPIWIDLTKYVEWEQGDTTLVVGGYNRSLTGSSTETPGTRPPTANTTIPAAPTWVQPFALGVYQSPVSGLTRSQVVLVWTRPLNTDGSAMNDAAYYEIRYRTSTTPIFPVTWGQLGTQTWGEIQATGGTWGNPLKYENVDWQYLTVTADELRFMLQELTPNMPYEAQVRAVDTGSPPNAGAWSTLAVWQTTGDTIAPSTPAPPTVAASLIGVQITHTLGVAGGGTYNLELDMNHLEIHQGTTNTFEVSNATLIGKLPVTAGMITGLIPAVGGFKTDAIGARWYRVVAVDEAGNASQPSVSVAATATLIDDQHVQNLTVTKVTAGTISADWFVGARIKTGNTGARAELNTAGVELFNSGNTRTVFLDASTGKGYFTGQVQSGTVGTRIVMNEEVGGTFFPEMRFYPSTGSTYSYINAPSTGNASLGMNSGGSGGYQTTLWLFDNDARLSYTQVGTGSTRGGSVRINADNVWMEIYDTAGTLSAGVVHLSRTFATLGWRHPDGRDANLSIYDDEVLYFKGYGARGFANGGRAALWLDNIGWAGGSVSFGYGATMIGDVCINASWTDFTGYLNVGVVVFNSTNTSFMVGNGTAGRNGFYSAQVWRIKP
jgi:hypothetical protein